MNIEHIEINLTCSSSYSYLPHVSFPARKLSKSFSPCCSGSLLNTLRVMTPTALLQSMRPIALLQASPCRPLPWLHFIIFISTMFSERAWRSVWPCATWSIGRSVSNETCMWFMIVVLSHYCLCNLTFYCVLQRLSVLTAQHWPKQPQDKLLTSYLMMSTNLMRWVSSIYLSFMCIFHLMSQFIYPDCNVVIHFNVFSQVTLYLHFLWIGPLQAATVILLLMYAIGPSCLAGMAVFFILMPIQTMFGRLFSTLRLVVCCFPFFEQWRRPLFNWCWYCCIYHFRAETAVLTDERIRTMNEVISGIRVIKMYGWEMPFSALVDEIRR